MTKKFGLFIISMCLILSTSACSKQPDKSKMLEIILVPSLLYEDKNDKIDECSIDYLLTTVTESEIITDVDAFKNLAKKPDKVIYTPLGNSIEIHFIDQVPDAYILYDYIIDKDGVLHYGKETIEQVPLELIENTLSFTLSENLMVNLSSSSEVYKKGGILRGFRLLCEFEDKQIHEYAFIIRTDSRLNT